MKRALLVLALVACDSSKRTTRDGLIAGLGAHDVVVAIDFAKLDIAAFAKLIPDPVACVRSVMERNGVLVAGLGTGDSEVYWTKLPEAPTRECFEKIVTHYDLNRGERAPAWKNGVMTFQEAGRPPTTTLSAEMLVQLGKAPRGAAIVVAIGASEPHRITGATLWIEDAGDSIKLVAIADGKDPEAAKSYLGSHLTQLLTDNPLRLLPGESLFKMTSPSPLTARVDATIPKSELYPSGGRAMPLQP